MPEVNIYDQIPDEETYGAIVKNADPNINDIVQGIDIVKQFIIDRGLILYGGTAIDYALRLKGSSLYSDDMLKAPDFDFYSPNNVNDAYDLTEMLMAKFDDVGSLVAMHPQTMRVRLKYNYVADITFVDKSMFDLIPTLTYEGMKFVHPHFQRIDMLFSLTFPLDNPPMENITNRLKKDNDRIAMLEEKYPIMVLPNGNTDDNLSGNTFSNPNGNPSSNTDGIPSSNTDGKQAIMDVTVIKVPLSDIKDGILDGFAAYALICQMLKKKPKNMLNISINDDPPILHIELPTIYGELDIIDNDHASIMTRFAGISITHYEELLNIRSKYMKIKPSYGIVNVGEYPNKWLPINSHQVGNVTLKCVCGPAVMMFMLSRMFIDSAQATTYATYYKELLDVVNDDAMKISDVLYKTGDNLYPSTQIMMMAEKFNMRLETENVNLEKPKGYYEGNQRPTFDHTNSRFFKSAGRPIIDTKVEVPVDNKETIDHNE
jgi:hypothetical protein